MALPPQAYGGLAATAALDYRPVDTTLTANNHDLLGSLAECQLGTGRNAPAGTTLFGFTDTTYLPTTAQILQQTTTGQV
jgi:hypothetical protein